MLQKCIAEIPYWGLQYYSAELSNNLSKTRIGCSAEHMCHLPGLFQKIDKGE